MVESPDEVAALQKCLQQQCKRWQRLLRLSDWNVLVKLCRLNEMDRDCIGSIYMYHESKDAVMRLLSPLDLPLVSEHFTEEETNYDLTIVHELLHLHFSPFQADDDTPAGIAQEQAINCISQALLAGHAKKAHPPTAPVGDPSVGHYL